MVKRHFDADALIRICEADSHDFGKYGQFVELADYWRFEDRFYYYQDNGSDILAIAHLDTVQANRQCTVSDTGAGLLATSGALDDRLGAYIILELLPALGVNTDILLTTDEEHGQSTAEDFTPPDNKYYNWMFSFDRMGTDVVMYQYETKGLCEMLETCGAHVGTGIFSCISVLDFLGCSGFNWGCGYQDYHSARSHAWLEDTFRQVARFVKFYRLYGGMMLPYLYDPPKRLQTWYGGGNGWKDDDEDDEEYRDWLYRNRSLSAPEGFDENQDT